MTHLFLKETTCFSAVRSVSAVAHATMRARTAKILCNMFMMNGLAGKVAEVLEFSSQKTTGFYAARPPKNAEMLGSP